MEEFMSKLLRKYEEDQQQPTTTNERNIPDHQHRAFATFSVFTTINNKRLKVDLISDNAFAHPIHRSQTTLNPPHHRSTGSRQSTQNPAPANRTRQPEIGGQNRSLMSLAQEQLVKDRLVPSSTPPLSHRANKIAQTHGEETFHVHHLHSGRSQRRQTRPTDQDASSRNDTLPTMSNPMAQRRCNSAPALHRRQRWSPDPQQETAGNSCHKFSSQGHSTFDRSLRRPSMSPPSSAAATKDLIRRRIVRRNRSLPVGRTAAEEHRISRWTSSSSATDTSLPTSGIKSTNLAHKATTNTHSRCELEARFQKRKISSHLLSKPCADCDHSPIFPVRRTSSSSLTKDSHNNEEPHQKVPSTRVQEELTVPAASFSDSRADCQMSSSILIAPESNYLRNRPTLSEALDRITGRNSHDTPTYPLHQHLQRALEVVTDNVQSYDGSNDNDGDEELAGLDHKTNPKKT